MSLRMVDRSEIPADTAKLGQELMAEDNRFSGNLRGNLQIGYFLQRITQISLIFYLLFGQFVKFVADFHIDPAKS